VTAPAVPSELEEQSQLVAWAQDAQQAHPELRLLFAIPNGEHRHWTVAKRLKAQGVRAGVPDLFLPAPRSGWHGLFLELKRRDGGVVSDHQAGWHLGLTQQGYMVAVCRGATDARNALIKYLELPT